MEFVNILVPSLIGALIPAAITYIVLKKNIEHQEKILNITEKNKFRLAAIDKKLEIAQQAYNLSKEFSKFFNPEGRKKIVNESTEWWYKNCLYLDQNVRKDFDKCLRDMVDIIDENAKPQRDPKKLKKFMRK